MHAWLDPLVEELQRRFRTCGQFWKRQGLTHLLRLSVLCKNQDAVLLWNPSHQQIRDAEGRVWGAIGRLTCEITEVTFAKEAS